MVLVGLWAVVVTVALQTSAWLAEQARIAVELPVPWLLWPVAGALTALFVGIPAALLALLPRAAVARAVGRVWGIAALLLGVLSLARAVPVAQPATYLLLLIGLALIATLSLRRLRDRRPADFPPRSWAVAAGLAALAPWVCVGALGGALETVAAAAAAVALGRLAARLPLPAFPGSGWRVVGLGGLVTAVALTLLAGGTGMSGTALAALVALPALGFPAAALGAPRSRGVLVGLAAFGPLGFVDPMETSLVLGERDVGWWALLAALATLLIGLLAGLAGALGRHALPRRGLARLTAVALAGTTLAGYLTLGHPGWYGDQLFVILKAQADLGNLPADPGARRAEVYRRLVDTAERTQAPLRQELSRLHLTFTPFYLVNGLRVDAGPALRDWLAHRPGVDRVLRNPRLRPLPAPPPPLTGRLTVDGRPQWSIGALHADRVWAAGTTGQGIVVGSSDTGVDGRHPALASSFRGGQDSWYDPDSATTTPTDGNGHGTHTLGSAVGGNGVGVAPGARWIGCVNLSRALGNLANYLGCLQFMLAPFGPGADPLRDGQPGRAADVLVNSWSCPELEGCDDDALRPAVDALTAAGVFVVVAAGNTGPHCATVTDPPARYPAVLAVGAVDRTGRQATFSSRGADKPELFAPGVDIVSALPGGGYGALSGTSMAAPPVAGVVALMWSANPHLIGDVPTTRRLLLTTATPLTGSAGCGNNAGMVDADAAVRAARAAGP
jgi:hypothetical protein